MNCVCLLWTDSFPTVLFTICIISDYHTQLLHTHTQTDPVLQYRFHEITRLPAFSAPSPSEIVTTFALPSALRRKITHRLCLHLGRDGPFTCWRPGMSPQLAWVKSKQVRALCCAWLVLLITVTFDTVTGTCSSHRSYTRGYASSPLSGDFRRLLSGRRWGPKGGGWPLLLYPVVVWTLVCVKTSWAHEWMCLTCDCREVGEHQCSGSDCVMVFLVVDVMCKDVADCWCL